MRFNQFVFRNTFRNRKVYLAYFLSTLLTVMTFFTFIAFRQHPQLATDEMFDAVKTGLMITSVIMVFFSFFYIYYSMDVFLQSRKKEFGLLLLQGLSPSQLKKMVFQENCLIGILAAFFGSILGFIFSQGILLLGEKLFHTSLNFYFPWEAFVTTMIVFSLLFILIAFFMRYKIPKLNLQVLLKSEEEGKGMVKVANWKAWVACLLLVVGYGIALFVKGTLVVAVMFPVIFIVVWGTKWFFQEYSVRFIQKLKQKTPFFWKKTNLLVLSDLAFRMKDNARSFFFVTIISTVAFSAIGTLYGFKSIMMDTQNYPYDFTAFGSASEVTSATEIFEGKLASAKVNGTSQTMSAITFYRDNGVSYYATSFSMYNAVAQLAHQKELTPMNSVMLVGSEQIIENAEDDVLLGSLGKKSVSEKNISMLFSGYAALYVIPDDEYNLLKNQNPNELVVYKCWNLPGVSEKTQESLGEEMFGEEIFTSKIYTINEMNQGYAPILYIGLFIGIIFFISAGSFLYFRLYSDMPLDMEKFRRIYKIGLTKRELQKMIYQQVGILFFTPMIVSFFHGLVALTAMYHMVMRPLQIEAFLVLGSFVIIQLVYYFIARKIYFKKVYQAISAN